MQFSNFLERVITLSIVRQAGNTCLLAILSWTEKALFASRRSAWLETMESASYLAVFGLQYVYEALGVCGLKTFESHNGKEFLLCATLMSVTSVSVSDNKLFDNSAGLIFQSDWIKIVI